MYLNTEKKSESMIVSYSGNAETKIGRERGLCVQRGI